MSREFDGTFTKYLQRDYTPLVAVTMTVCFAFKAFDNNPAATQTIFYYGNKTSSGPDYFSIDIKSNGTLQVADQVKSAIATSAVDVADGNWHTCVATELSSGGNITVGIKIDNAAIVSTTIAGSNAFSSHNRLAFGGYRGAGTGAYFNGRVSKAMMFNRVLSSQEQTDYFKYGDVIDRTNCVGDWDMDATDTTVVADDTIVFGNLFIVGSPYSSDEMTFLSISSNKPRRTLMGAGA